jgi:hypothetical protein
MVVRWESRPRWLQAVRELESPDRGSRSVAPGGAGIEMESGSATIPGALEQTQEHGAIDNDGIAPPIATEPPGR